MIKPAPHPIVGRFAPSPTGMLHTGSLVTAVGSWLMAKKGGGRWLLRMDNLDTPRVVPGVAADIQRTLERFGLLWDGEISWQNRHIEAYSAAFEHLASKGVIFPCFCSRKDIMAAASAPHEEEQPPRYPGICRNNTNNISNIRHIRSYRLQTPDEDICFQDLIAGRYCQNLQQFCGDFVIRRSLTEYAYQLAVVVDDHLTGVNQVVRGNDLLSSTPRQIYLQQLLDITSNIVYAHLPIVTASNGSKLSKRDNIVSSQVGEWKNREPLLMLDILQFLGVEIPQDLVGTNCEELLKFGLQEFEIPRIPTGNRCLVNGIDIAK